MRLPPAEPKRARIEIVPMIDAIFFLLVFFMYSSLSMVKLNGVTLAIPQSPGSGTRTPGPAKDAPHLMVEVRASGATTVAGATTATASLARTVEARMAERPGAVVVLRAEKGSEMQRLVSVLDALNDVRLKGGARPTVLIATEKVTDPAAGR
jgi:biopolymer transport protein ExbD